MSKITLELTQEQINALNVWISFGVGYLRQMAEDTKCIVTEENMIDRVVVLNDILDMIDKAKYHA